MSKKTFRLSDFDSRACEVVLPGEGGTELVLSLRKFTLLDRIWVEREWGTITKWETTLFPQTGDYSETEWLKALIKTTHHLLEPEIKKKFDTWEKIAGSLESSIEILMGLQKAVLYVLRGSEPLIEEFEKQVKKTLDDQEAPKAKKKTRKKRAAKRKTGHK